MRKMLTRRAESTPARERAALMIARRWAAAEKLARVAVGASDIIQRTIGTSRDGAAAAYFPACINRIFGRDPGRRRSRSLPQTLVDVSARAGKPLWIPGDVAGKCCSTPWSSKGYNRGHRWMAAATCDALWEWSGHGTLPVVIDAASCTNGLLDDVRNYLDPTRLARLETITLLDSIAWCESLLPALTITHRLERAAVHPTCSTTHIGLTRTLEAWLAVSPTRSSCRWARPAAAPLVTAGCCIPSWSSRPPATRRPGSTRCPPRHICRPTEPAKWDFARRPAARTSPSFSCWRN